MTEELKPCPFCGEIKDIAKYWSRGCFYFYNGIETPSYGYIKCHKCNSIVNGDDVYVAGDNDLSDLDGKVAAMKSLDTAIAIWNNRPIEDKFEHQRDVVNDALVELSKLYCVLKSQLSERDAKIENLKRTDECTCTYYCDCCYRTQDETGFQQDDGTWCCSECDGNEMSSPYIELYSEMSDVDKKCACRDCLLLLSKETESMYINLEVKLAERDAEIERLKKELDGSQNRRDICKDDVINKAVKYLIDNPEHDILQTHGENKYGDFTLIIMRGKQEHTKPLVRAKAEIERLKNLVKKAYWEGFEYAVTHAPDKHINQSWNKSNSRQALGEKGGEA